MAASHLSLASVHEPTADRICCLGGEPFATNLAAAELVDPPFATAVHSNERTPCDPSCQHAPRPPGHRAPYAENAPALLPCWLPRNALTT